MRRAVVIPLAIIAFLLSLVVGQIAFRSQAEAAAPSGSYNVKSYGATGDGTTDDTAAINSACAALADGGSLYFPGGTYIVKAPQAGTNAIIGLAKKNIKVYGDGVGISTIKVANSSPTYSWLLGPAAGPPDLTGLEITGLTFDQNVANNPVTADNWLTWGRFTCGTWVGNNIKIHDIEIKNTSSVDCLVIGGDNYNVTINNVTASNIGGVAGDYAHDLSLIYIEANTYSVTNCHLTATSPFAPSARSAIEAHGTNYTITGNTCTNWGCGILAVGDDFGGAKNCVVSNNTMNHTLYGITMWPEPPINGAPGAFAIDGMQIENNTINIETVNDATPRAGIVFFYDCPKNANNLTISGNTIVCPDDATPNAAGGIGWPYATATPKPTVSNSTVLNNSVTGFGARTYVWDCNVVNVTVSGNLSWTKTTPPPTAPAITSMTPASATVGTEVTLAGTAFGATQGTSYVSFGSTKATDYTSWSDTQVKCKVPSGASRYPSVTVMTAGGTSNSKSFRIMGSIGSTSDDNPLIKVHSSFYFAEGYTGPDFAEYLCLGNPGGKDANAVVTYMFSDGTAQDASYEVPAGSRYTVNVNGAVGPGREVSIRVISDSADLVAERPMYFNYNGSWTGGSDAVGATAPARDWYFAEGNTLPNFEEYVTVLNPGSAAASLTFHYMVEGKGEQDVGARVGPNSRATFKTRDQIGSGKNASLYLESDRDVVAERPMYFNYQGIAANSWTGGHDVVGANAPARDWYFAEGTTRSGFEQWLTLQNPGTVRITVNATYMLGAGQGGPVKKSYSVPPGQRLTVPVNAELGPGKDNSVHLTSTSGFIAERPVYFDYRGAWDGGHVVLGANSPATTWVFAEGCTAANFNEWLCVQNPGGDTAHLSVTYYTSSGAPITKPWTVAPGSRLTVDVNADAGPGLEVCARVTSDKPVIAECPMYFNYQGYSQLNWTGGHDVVGIVPR